MKSLYLHSNRPGTVGQTDVWVSARSKRKVRRRTDPPVRISVVYFTLGDRGRGFEWLEKAYVERSNGIAYMAVEPAYNSLRGDPRFRDLLRRAGLPE
jgi:hypothetical protein